MNADHVPLRQSAISFCLRPQTLILEILEARISVWGLRQKVTTWFTPFLDKVRAFFYTELTAQDCRSHLFWSLMRTSRAAATHTRTPTHPRTHTHTQGHLTLLWCNILFSWVYEQIFKFIILSLTWNFSLVLVESCHGTHEHARGHKSVKKLKKHLFPSSLARQIKWDTLKL
jgi:hypothetical protein